jgi:hypothetical protein
LPQDERDVDAVWESYGVMPFADARFDPAGERLVTTAGDAALKVWSPFQDCDPLFDLPPIERTFAQYILFSDDSSTSAVVYLDLVVNDRQIVRLVDMKGRREISVRELGRSDVLRDVDRRGRRLLVSNGNEAYIYESASLTMLEGALEHRDQIVGASFDDTDRRIVTTSRDGTVRVWDTETLTAITPPLRFMEQPPGWNGAPWEDDIAPNLSTARFDGEGSVVLVYDEGDPSSFESKPVRFRWQVAFGGSRAEALALADFAEHLAGLRINASGVPEPFVPAERQDLRRTFQRRGAARSWSDLVVSYVE